MDSKNNPLLTQLMTGVKAYVRAFAKDALVDIVSKQVAQSTKKPRKISARKKK